MARRRRRNNAAARRRTDPLGDRPLGPPAVDEAAVFRQTIQTGTYQNWVSPQVPRDQSNTGRSLTRPFLNSNSRYSNDARQPPSLPATVYQRLPSVAAYLQLTGKMHRVNGIYNREGTMFRDPDARRPIILETKNTQPLRGCVYYED